MIPKTPTDYVGTGHQVTLASILGVTKCKWFQVTGTSIASTAGRVGDSTIEADGGGFPIITSGGQFAPPIASQFEFYDLEQWYIILVTADTARIGCAL